MNEVLEIREVSFTQVSIESILLDADFYVKCQIRFSSGDACRLTKEKSLMPKPTDTTELRLSANPRNQQWDI